MGRGRGAPGTPGQDVEEKVMGCEEQGRPRDAHRDGWEVKNGNKSRN